MLNVSDKLKDALMSDCRYIRTFVDMYSNGDDKPPVTYSEEIIDITITESTGATIDQPIGNVMSNELSFSVHDPGNQYSLINPDSIYKEHITKPIRCVVRLSVEVESNVFEEVPMGTFYTAGLDNLAYNQTTNILAYDRMYYIFDDTCGAIIKTHDSNTPMTIREMFSRTFSSVGLREHVDYEIDSGLNVSVQQAYCEPATLKERLKQLSSSFGCIVYVNKYNVIKVVSQLNTLSTGIVFTEDNQIIDANVMPSYTDAYSAVSLTYPLINENSKESVFSASNVCTSATGINSVLINFDKPLSKVVCISVVGGMRTTLSTYTISSTGIVVYLHNTGNQETVDIIVSGMYLDVDTNKYEIRDEHLAAQIGSRCLQIHSRAYISDSFTRMYADTLLKIGSNISPIIHMDVRGFPLLEPNDCFAVATEKYYTSSTTYTPIEIVYTMGNGLTATVQGITADSRLQFTHAYVGFGLSIKVPKKV